MRCVALLLVAAAASAAGLRPFSEMGVGDVTEPWRLQKIRGRPAASFRVIEHDGIVVEAFADGSVASLVHPVEADPGGRPVLVWRWRIEDPVDGSALHARDRDDFPARVYALFDYDVGRLPLGERWKLRVARLIYGRWVPAAALCYVPLDGVEPGTIAANAYTGRVQMVVIGGVHTGAWRSFERDVAADFEAAFGEPAPRLAGVAIAIDTDDTGDTARALFGDVRLVSDTGN